MTGFLLLRGVDNRAADFSSSLPPRTAASTYCAFPVAQPKQTPAPEPVAETAMNYEFVRCSAMETEDAGETAFFFTSQDDNLLVSVSVQAHACWFVISCILLQMSLFNAVF